MLARMSEPKVCVVVGVGPGLGASAARRFAKGGFDVALVARRKEVLDPIAAQIEGLGRRALAVPADASDEAAVQRAYAEIERGLGAPSVLVYNTGAFHVGGVLELSPQDFESAWKTLCFGAFLWARAVAPAMLARSAGTMIFTGATAALRGGARFSGLAVGKFGLRALAQSLARELHPKGVHVAHVIIDGQIDTERVRAMMPGRDGAEMLSPDAIADTYWHLHAQPSTTWTHELDLRPNVEKF
jgi:NAD(P)-dependent dehydrogenase (short-subunit alcohol dehydrogenase family)